MSVIFRQVFHSEVNLQAQCPSCHEISADSGRHWYAHPNSEGDNTDFIHESCFHQYVFEGGTQCPGGCNQTIQYGRIPIRSLKGRIYYTLNHPSMKYIGPISALPTVFTMMSLMIFPYGLPPISQIWFGSISGGILQYGIEKKKLPASLTSLAKKVSKFTQGCDLGRSVGKYAVYLLTPTLAYESIEVITYLASGTPLWQQIIGIERWDSDIPYYAVHLLAAIIIPIFTLMTKEFCAESNKK